jgi:hypothetical protein
MMTDDHLMLFFFCILLAEGLSLELHVIHCGSKSSSSMVNVFCNLLRIGQLIDSKEIEKC